MEKIEVVFEPAERLVGIVEFQGAVYVATERRVYRMRQDRLTDTVAFEPVVFHQPIEGQRP